VWQIQTNSECKRSYGMDASGIYVEGDFNAVLVSGLSTESCILRRIMQSTVGLYFRVQCKQTAILVNKCSKYIKR
jgi:hypothetical protein